MLSVHNLEARKVLELDHYELIRRKHEIDGLSQREIARQLGHSRKTVAKALQERIPPGYRLREPRPRPVIEPVKHIIDAWLEQNQTARRKRLARRTKTAGQN